MNQPSVISLARFRALIVKLALIVGGALVPLALGEVGLRIAASFMRADRSVPPAADDGALHVLCIGESTTRGMNGVPWPAQLEEILNRETKVRFTVFNQGVVGIATPELVELLPKWIELYRPHIIVSMIGINDSFDHALVRPPRSRCLRELTRRSKLAKFLFLLAQSRRPATATPAPERAAAAAPLDDPLAESKRLSALRLYDQVQELLQRAIAASPRYELYLELADIQARHLRNTEIAIASYHAAIALDGGRYEALLELGRLTRDLPLLEQAIAARPELVQSYLVAATELGRSGRRDEGEQLLLSHKPTSPQMELEKIVALAHFYETFGDVRMLKGTWNMAIHHHARTPDTFIRATESMLLYKELDTAKEFAGLGMLTYAGNPWMVRTMIDVTFVRGEYSESRRHAKTYMRLVPKPAWMPPDASEERQIELTMLRFHQLAHTKKYADATGQVLELRNPITDQSYDEILRLARRAGARLFAMQYPRLPIEDLRETLGDAADVTFIANSENFERALAARTYSDLFSDDFALCFGHLTTAGNALIARGVADAIKAQLDDRQAGR